MKLRDENKKTGHLLAFISKVKDEDNFSLFFPVEGLDQFDALLEITKGFERCLKPFENKYKFMNYSIADIGRLEEIFPGVDKERMLRFDLQEFLDEHSKFIDVFGKSIFERQIQRQKPIFPTIITGAMATESNFYDRETELDEIWKNLQKGKNLLLRAPRRYGKSSLLEWIFKNPLDKWHVCNVDLQGGKSSEDFVELLMVGLTQSKDLNIFLPNYLADLEVWNKTESNKLEIVRSEREKIRKNWEKYAESIFASIDSGPEEYQFLLILDEVSFLIEDIIGTKGQNKDAVNKFMAWFYNARKKAEKISFILSGSEHLPTFLKSFGIEGYLDDLEPINLNLFDQQVAKEFIFLTLAGKKIVVCSAEIDRILALIGEPIPYFLQLFLDTLSITCREGQSLSIVDIESAYYRELLGSKSKRYFEPIELQLDRYNRYGDRNRSGAKSVLDELAVNDSVDREDLKTIWQNATNNNQFDVMFSIIKDDFYIKEEDNSKVSFASKLLKDWWVRHCLTGKR